MINDGSINNKQQANTLLWSDYPLGYHVIDAKPSYNSSNVSWQRLSILTFHLLRLHAIVLDYFLEWHV